MHESTCLRTFFYLGSLISLYYWELQLESLLENHSYGYISISLELLQGSS